MALFFVLGGGTWLGLHYMLARRMLAGLELSRRNEKIVWGTLAFVAAFPLVMFIGARLTTIPMLYQLMKLEKLLFITLVLLRWTLPMSALTELIRS